MFGEETFAQLRTGLSLQNYIQFYVKPQTVRLSARKTVYIHVYVKPHTVPL